MTDFGATPFFDPRSRAGARRRSGRTLAAGIGGGMALAVLLTLALPMLGHGSVDPGIFDEPVPLVAAPRPVAATAVHSPSVAVPVLREARLERRHAPEPRMALPAHVFAPSLKGDAAAGFAPGLSAGLPHAGTDRFAARASEDAVALAALAAPVSSVPQVADATEIASLATPSLERRAEEEQIAALVPTPRAAPRPAPRAARPVVVARLTPPETPQRRMTRAEERAEARARARGLAGRSRALPSGSALAYARPDAGLDRDSRGALGALLNPLPSPSLTPDRGPSRGLTPRAGNGVAIYDILASTVYMPNGEKLLAQSGLGPLKNKPQFANVRNRGVTPPHIYNLAMRESLFHGHAAIRLHPVGGKGRIFNRDGLLAHPYLLGPGGDSNGCVSFKNYGRFLAAFRRGEVKRLIVVPSLANSGARVASLLAMKG